MAANKTDDVMFLPSSNAIKHAQGQTGRGRSAEGEQRSASSPPSRAASADEEADEAALGVEGEEEEAFV